MDPNQYYQDLIQQGYSGTDAAHFTQQYYPDFQGTVQGMSMMTPPPPGSMEMGGLVAGGFGAPAGGMAAGAGMAATGAGAGGLAAGGLAGAAAAGGGMSMATIAVVSILVLGGAGTGGYFLYDYLTEPDFYGEVYWTEMGYGFIFEEDSLKMALTEVDGGCEFYEDEDIGFEDIENTNNLCIMEMNYDKYTSEDKGDYYKICITNNGDDELGCFQVYPMERGAVIDDNGECNILVSDISNPEFSMFTEDGPSKAQEEWEDNFFEIAEEILDDDDAPSCSDGGLAEPTSEEELDGYQFRDRNPSEPLDAEGGNPLVHIMMVQGFDLNWALVEVRIIVDGGASLSCDEEGWASNTSSCVYTTDDDNYWAVRDEITVSEGTNADLCDGSNDCVVDVMIIKKAVGENDGKVFLSASEGDGFRNPDNFGQFDWRDALNDPEMSEYGGDALIHIQMMTGQPISWALVEVSIGYPSEIQECVDINNPDEDGQMCTYSFDDGKNWNLGEEITISEGANQELCDGVAEFCEIVVTIGQKAVGDSDGREYHIWTDAEA